VFHHSYFLQPVLTSNINASDHQAMDQGYEEADSWNDIAVVFHAIITENRYCWKDKQTRSTID